jgi:hypothetical protein
LIQKYISNAGESSFETGCPCGKITYWINSQSVRKKAISPATRAATLFGRGISGVASIRAIKAIMVIDEPYKNFSVSYRIM